MLPALLAFALAAAEPEGAPQSDEEPVYTEPADRFRLTAIGGTVLELNSGGAAVPIAGVQAAYVFESLDLAIVAQGYKFRPSDNPASTWSPVILARIEERFETRRGVEATLSFGFGAGRVTSWLAWYQVALGVRLGEGPVFFGGEIGFEQYQLLRLAASLGVKF